jgi:pimeloyl-ACP methyl ester carboxylesterase
MALVAVNGTELYHEVRGSGPPVLLIMGFTGDGGHFETLAELLADEFTVVTYDRRGNGRSPRPAGWVKTSPEEQADDAAALLAALDLGPAGVYGSSAGASFALCLTSAIPSGFAARSCTSRPWCGCLMTRGRAVRSRRSSRRP